MKKVFPVCRFFISLFCLAFACSVAGGDQDTPDEMEKDAGMVLIPAGSFSFGTAGDDVYFEQGDVSERNISLQAFHIDIYEYPNRPGALPMVNVNWYEARALCKEQGKRLCTEEEWEKACKGPEGSRFPYGSDEKPGCCFGNGPAYPDADREPSGTRPCCVSGYGVYDMSGNVNEWTSSRQSSSSGEGYPILKGGDYGNAFSNLRCSNRDHYHRREERFHDDGFRCCRTAAVSGPAERTGLSELKNDGDGN